jgi:Helicase associated domain
MGVTGKKKSRALTVTHHNIIAFLRLRHIHLISLNYSHIMNTQHHRPYSAPASIVSILSCAENVISKFHQDCTSDGDTHENFYTQEKDFPLFLNFEPTPIGRNGVTNVVTQVPIPNILNWNVEENCSASFKSQSPVKALRIPSTSLPGEMGNVDDSAIAWHSWQLNEGVNCHLVTEHENPAPVASAPSSLSSPWQSSTVMRASKDDTEAMSQDAPNSHRQYLAGQWNERFQDLIHFGAVHGHLFVPHSYPENKKLAQWVKR